MLYLLSGTDRFRLLERKQEITQLFFRTHPHGEQFSIDIEEGWDESTRSQCVEATISGGLFATPHLVTLRGGECLDDRAGAWLVEMLPQHAASTTIVLSYWVAPRKKLPAWWEQLALSGTHEIFGKATIQECTLLIEALLRDMAMTIEPAAQRLLATALTQDCGRLTQEVKRLALSAEKGQITLVQTEAMVTLPREQQVFVALDRLTRGDRALATALFRREETDPSAPFSLLGLCAWQVRRLIAVKELAEVEHMSASMISQELKVKLYPIQKMLPLSAQLSFQRLKRGLVLLADLDRLMKTGRIRPGVALDLFVWKF